MTDHYEDLAALPTAKPDAAVGVRIERQTQAWRYKGLRGYAHEVEKRDAAVKHPSTLLMYELNQMRGLMDSVAERSADTAAIHEVRVAIGNVQRAAFHNGVFLDGAIEVSSKTGRQPRMWQVGLRETSSLEQVDARVTQVSIALMKLDGVLERLVDAHRSDAKSRVMIASMQRHAGTVRDIVSHSQYSIERFAKRDGASR